MKFMREDNYKSKEVVENICNQIWSCIDVLRSSVIDENLLVILLLISVYKNALMKNLNDIELYNVLDDFRNEIVYDLYYSRLDAVYRSIIDSIFFKKLNELYHYFSFINRRDFELILQRNSRNETCFTGSDQVCHT